MKNILVTGSNGFIGKSLVKSLLQFNYHVVHFNSMDGEIENIDLFKRFENTRIDYIFHLAAKTFVPDSWEDPTPFYMTTVIGTQRVLELCRKKDIPMTFVSAYLYGAPDIIPILETTELKPNNPYAHSKYLAENLCKFYSDYYDVKVTIARPFNVYGENQKDNFLIPHIINQVMHDEFIKVKDLRPKRDYIYIDDLIDALIKTINVQNKFSVFNFGAGVEYSVQEIIDTIQEIAQTSKQVLSEQVERKNEIMHVIADISKARQELGWEPKYSFKDGIKKILKKVSNC